MLSDIQTSIFAAAFVEDNSVLLDERARDDGRAALLGAEKIGWVTSRPFDPATDMPLCYGVPVKNPAEAIIYSLTDEGENHLPAFLRRHKGLE